jgi:hypothetical protein
VIRIDIEELSLQLGIKPARRIAIDPGERPGALDRAAARDLAIIEAHRLASIGGRERAVLYLAPDLGRARAVRDAEARVLPGGAPSPPDREVLDAHRLTGTLLGYPPCCVEAFVRRVARGVTTRADGSRGAEETIALEDAAARSGRYDARLNVLRRRDVGALIAFHPCALDCLPALALAQRTLDALEHHDPSFAAALMRALRSRAPDGEHALSVAFE